MGKDVWFDLLKALEKGEICAEEAYRKLKVLPYEDLGYAKIDHHRKLRQDMAEVVFCPGKTHEQVATIVKNLAKRGGNVLATRATKEVFAAVHKEVPKAEYNATANLIVVWEERKRSAGKILVVSAGTADQSVAEEAAVTAEVLGSTVVRLSDVGVSGIHRLIDHRKVLNEARVIIVVAGMEGALASVVGGLVSCPVIAVPTSVGYGANFQGLAPLLTMLNSCAAGVSVVNIDNGFGAAVMAHRINMIGEGVALCE